MTTADRPAIIGRDGVPSNTTRTGTRCVTLTQLPLAFCAGNWVKVTQRVPVRVAFDEVPKRAMIAGLSAEVEVDLRNAR